MQWFSCLPCTDHLCPLLYTPLHSTTSDGVQRGGARVATNNPTFVPFATWLTNTSAGQLINQQQAQLSNGTNGTNGTAAPGAGGGSGSADPWVISLEDFAAQRTAGQPLTVDLYVVDSEDPAHLDPGVQTALLQFMASGRGAWGQAGSLAHAAVRLRCCC